MADGRLHPDGWLAERELEGVCVGGWSESLLSVPPVADLHGLGRSKRFGPKEIIYRQHDLAGRVYLVRSGLVKLLNHLPNGQVRIVRLRTGGQWFGYEGVMGCDYWHTAVVVDGAETLSFQGNALQALENGLPTPSGYLLQQWCDDLAQADRWISDFSTGEIKPRVVRLLQYLAELEYGRPIYRVKLLTVQEMAEILGVTQESVSRVLAGLKRSRILQKLPPELSGTSRETYWLDADGLALEALR